MHASSFFVLFFITIIVAAIAAAASSSSNGNGDDILHRDIAQLTTGWTMQATNSFPNDNSAPNFVRVTQPYTAPSTVFRTLVENGYIIGSNGEKLTSLDAVLEGYHLKHIKEKLTKYIYQPYVFQFTAPASGVASLFPPLPSGASSLHSFLLKFKGINYRANLTVNGKPVATETSFVGTFREFVFDVTQEISNSSAPLSIALTMSPPLNKVFPPVNPTVDLSMTLIDWGPHPPDAAMGIWRDVELIRTVAVSGKTTGKKAQSQKHHLHRRQQGLQQHQCAGEIRFPVVTTFINSGNGKQPPTPTPLAQYNNVIVGVSLLWTATAAEARFPPRSSFSIECSLATPSSKQTIKSSATGLRIKAGGNKADGSFEQTVVLDGTNTFPYLLKEDLWWPWQMQSETQGMNITSNGAPASRADLTCTLISDDTSSSSACYTLKHKVGLRSAASQLVPVTSGADPSINVPNPTLVVLINNVRILIRGAGWTPDVFYRENERHRFETALLLTKNMGLNTLRLEGKFPSDDFFEIADELGIMLFPGWSCCDAWQHWSHWDKEQFTVANESLRSQLRRLRRHASAVAFFYSSDELPPTQVEAMYLQTFAAELWPNIKISTASDYVSTISGPSGVKMSGPYSYVPPVYWTQGAALNKLGGAFGFLSEGGPGEAPVTLPTLLRIAQGNISQLYPIGTQGTAATFSQLIQYHMGNPEGLFYDLRFYLPPLFKRMGAPKTPSDFAAMSQVQNYETMKAYMQSYVWNRYNSSGFVQWMLTSPWPGNLWNLYDYYFTPTGNYFAAQQANDKIAVIFDYNEQTIALSNGVYLAWDQVTVQVDVFQLDINNQLSLASSSHVMLPEPLQGDQVVRRFFTPSHIPVPNPSNAATNPMTFIFTSLNAVSATQEQKQQQQFTSQNLFFLSNIKRDDLNWSDSNFYRTAQTDFADHTAMTPLLLEPVTSRGIKVSACLYSTHVVQVEFERMDKGNSSCFGLLMFAELVSVGGNNMPTLPVLWSNNTVSLVPTTNPLGNKQTIFVRSLHSPVSSAANLIRVRNETFPVAQAC